MRTRTIYIFSFLFFLLVSGCFLQRNDYSDAHYKEHQELSDVNSHQTPKEIAKDFGNLSKKQKRAYKKQLKRTRKDITKRNKKKLKGKYFE